MNTPETVPPKFPLDFKGSALQRSPEIFSKIAFDLGWEVAAVQAVVAVEAAGAGFLKDGRPKILFERHKFHAFTEGAFSAKNPSISNAKAGGYKGGAGEYARLGQAIALDGDAALRATSWGLPQIMGFNAGLAGFGSAAALVAAFCRSEDAQLLAFGTFIRNSGLTSLGRARDWAGFAKRYNGPAYKANAYDQKLAAAYAAALSAARHGRDEARMRVAEIQAALNAAGFGPLVADGWMGAKTKSALRRFQAARKLKVDGVAGPKTLGVLLPADH